VMQERLGHADIGVTMNTYTHTVAKQHSQAGTRRENLADDALVVVRGGLMEIERLRVDATMTFAYFGE